MIENLAKRDLQFCASRVRSGDRSSPGLVDLLRAQNGDSELLRAAAAAAAQKS